MNLMSTWLNKAPNHWTRGRIKSLIRQSANGVWGEEPIGDSSDIACVRAADFDRKTNRVKAENLPKRKIDSSTLQKHVLKQGDVVLEKSGGGEKQPVGAAVLYDLEEPAVCTNFCMRISPMKNIDAKFLLYVFVTTYSQGITQSSIKQTTGIQNLDTSAFFSSPWAYPGIEEQRRISKFLDTETSHIDSIISARRKQRLHLGQRAISRAYYAIKGENEPGQRNPSGLEWLGSIPASWPIRSVASQFEVQLGKMLNSERAAGGNLRPYLRNTNVQWDRIDTEDLLEMDFPPSEGKRYQVIQGDLLICEGGQPGRAAIWDGRIEEIYYQKALHRARPRSESRARWLYYCLRAAAALDVFTSEGNSSTISHLTGEQLAGHRFPFPESEVQDRIIVKLDETASQENRLINYLDSQLDLLSERRQALITAAVTGQLDVTTARSGVR
ncbi:restriction endonuclease subunit S [Actinokineospora spheciospongiae]|uniref:restriction endonuclease subunit S n=1 Tax=Actinokineospora spheciospongiae TaxID=909613 RepID=UPI000D9FE2B7|nr:restriction endonuclease subunit S [Actinokineospora spheciospongiae]PWW62807.1 type I restriction enzyme S subunit [Actinokineospora spheciospongiae]